jgi:thiamine-phosphate diphosphorylase
MAPPTLSFSQTNGYWFLRINTRLLNADLFPNPQADLGSPAGRKRFQSAHQEWQDKGYVFEDAAVLALNAGDLFSIDRFPTLIDQRVNQDPMRSQAGPRPPPFPSLTNPRPGVYPIVDNLKDLRSLLEAGAKIIQLRIKTESTALRGVVLQAVELAKAYPQSQCFINDYWQLAIEAGAYGVHLGQDDLLTADLDAIARAGLRLGVSSHCFWEVVRAHTVQPSYIACGPLFPTRAKVMPWIAQGIENLHYWVNLLPYPIVGIGGVNTENLNAIHAAGAGAASVIQAIVGAPDPGDAYRALQRQWDQNESKEGSRQGSSTRTIAKPTLSRV